MVGPPARVRAAGARACKRGGAQVAAHAAADGWAVRADRGGGDGAPGLV